MFARYNSRMKKKTTAFAVLLCALLSIVAVATPASVGSIFADSYSAFAPLYTLYKGYANFLFSGSAVVVPTDLDEACPHLQEELGKLQMELITQTDSQRVEQVTRLAHLRQATAVFCQTYSQTIAEIIHPPSGDIDPLGQAADRGLFVAISDENKELEGLFSSTLDTYSGRLQWVFAVSFSMRTILNQKDLSRLDKSLQEILLGPEDAPYAPDIVPGEILLQAQELASLVGRALDGDEVERARHLAREIYDYLMK